MKILKNKQGNDSLTLVSFVKKEGVVNFAIMERMKIDYLVGIERGTILSTDETLHDLLEEQTTL